jgi:hypothetical protein
MANISEVGRQKILEAARRNNQKQQQDARDRYYSSSNQCELKKIKREGKVYRIYENEIGQIILDPMLLVPASEMWLHENKDAIKAVRKGLKEAAAGQLKAGPSYAKHAGLNKGHGSPLRYRSNYKKPKGRP